MTHARLGTPTGPLKTLAHGRLLAEFSLWSADLVRMAEDVNRVDAHVDIYHADVADGHFAPAMLLFPDLIASIRPLTDKPVHVHLMVTDNVLIHQIDQCADAGADIISIQAENTDIDRCIDHIRGKGIEAGLVLQLHTPVMTARPYLDRLSMMTLLGTKIGIKGADIDPQADARMKDARAVIDRSMAQSAGRAILLAADGGIREHSVPGLRKSGADTIVMGSLAFSAENLPARMRWIHELQGPI